MRPPVSTLITRAAYGVSQLPRVAWYLGHGLGSFSSTPPTLLSNASEIHRVVTTLDANNKSTTLFDSDVPLDVGKSGNPGAVLWITDTSPAGFSQEDTANGQSVFRRRTTVRCCGL